MKNQLINYKDGIWKKIKNFFGRLLSKKIIQRENTITEDFIKSDSQKERNFEKDIKVDEKNLRIDIKNMSLDSFIENLQWHPEWIEELSTDRLLKLIEYGEAQIEEYKKKIAKIKKNSYKNPTV